MRREERTQREPRAESEELHHFKLGKRSSLPKETEKEQPQNRKENWRRQVTKAKKNRWQKC